MDDILFLKHHQIEKHKWDSCIENSLQGQIYALSWYLDVVSPGWQALVVRKGDGYETVLPLPVKVQFGIPYLQQPLFCQQLGLFSKIAPLPEYYFEAFIEKIQEIFKYSIDYTLNADNSIQLALDSNTTTRYLSLNRSYQELYQAYKRDRKLNLKRGIKSGLVVKELHEVEALIDIFQKHTAHKIYGGVSDQAYTILRNLYKTLKSNNAVKLLGSFDHSGRVLTAALFTVWENKIIYLFCASTPEGRKLNGNTLVIDSLIQEYAGKEFVLDFESPESGPHQSFDGIDGFSESFGAERVILPQLKYNNLPAYIKLIKSFRMQVYKTFGF